VKALIVDDHSLFSESFSLLLKNIVDIDEVDAVTNAKDAMEYLRTYSCDLVFLDIHMPEINGMELYGMIRKKYPQLAVVVISMLDDKLHIMKMFRMGVRGYFLKNIGYKELQVGIERIMDGETYFPNDVADIIFNRSLSENFSNKFSATVDLSKREIEIVQFICEGLTSDEIAEKLFISKRTVDSHRTNIYKKIDVNNVTELITFALAKGIYLKN
jgi:DNA-binding NarL/FixJ family response regulator